MLAFLPWIPTISQALPLSSPSIPLPTHYFSLNSCSPQYPNCADSKTLLSLTISLLIETYLRFNCYKTNFAINLSLIPLTSLLPSVFPATLAALHPRVYVPLHVHARVNFSKKKIFCSNQGLNPSPHNSIQMYNPSTKSYYMIIFTHQTLYPYLSHPSISKILLKIK